MAAISLTLDYATGGGQPYTSGVVKIAQATAGDTSTGWVDGQFIAYPLSNPSTVLGANGFPALTQGTTYAVIPPDGTKVYVTMPATSSANISDLLPVTPPLPDPSALIDAAVAPAIATGTLTGEAFEDKLGASLLAGTNVTVTYNDTTGKTTIASTGGGGGAVSSVNTKTGVVVLTQDDVADGTTAKQYTATEKAKLAGVATGATANDTDANLKNRANHTGTQASTTISDSTTAGRALLTAADVNAQRSTLLIGNVQNTTDATKSVLSATKLTTARTINGVSFDGSANISIADNNVASTAISIGNALNFSSIAHDTTWTVTLSENVTTLTFPTVSGSVERTIYVVWKQAASGGPYNVSTPGTVKTITGVAPVVNQTAGGVSVWKYFWDGLEWIVTDLAVASKLATARTINGVSFDGSANITVADGTKQPLDADLTAIAALAPTDGQVLTWSTTLGAWTIANPTGGAEVALAKNITGTPTTITAAGGIGTAVDIAATAISISNSGGRPVTLHWRATSQQIAVGTGTIFLQLSETTSGSTVGLVSCLQELPNSIDYALAFKSFLDQFPIGAVTTTRTFKLSAFIWAPTGSSPTAQIVNVSDNPTFLRGVAG